MNKSLFIFFITGLLMSICSSSFAYGAASDTPFVLRGVLNFYNSASKRSSSCEYTFVGRTNASEQPATINAFLVIGEYARCADVGASVEGTILTVPWTMSKTADNSSTMTITYTVPFATHGGSCLAGNIALTKISRNEFAVLGQDTGTFCTVTGNLTLTQDLKDINY